MAPVRKEMPNLRVSTSLCRGGDSVTEGDESTFDSLAYSFNGSLASSPEGSKGNEYRPILGRIEEAVFLNNPLMQKVEDIILGNTKGQSPQSEGGESITGSTIYNNQLESGLISGLSGDSSEALPRSTTSRRSRYSYPSHGKTALSIAEDDERTPSHDTSRGSGKSENIDRDSGIRRPRSTCSRSAVADDLLAASSTMSEENEIVFGSYDSESYDGGGLWGNTNIWERWAPSFVKSPKKAPRVGGVAKPEYLTAMKHSTESRETEKLPATREIATQTSAICDSPVESPSPKEEGVEFTESQCRQVLHTLATPTEKVSAGRRKTRKKRSKQPCPSNEPSPEALSCKSTQTPSSTISRPPMPPQSTKVPTRTDPKQKSPTRVNDTGISPSTSLECRSNVSTSLPISSASKCPADTNLSVSTSSSNEKACGSSPGGMGTSPRRNPTETKDSKANANEIKEYHVEMSPLSNKAMERQGEIYSLKSGGSHGRISPSVDKNIPEDTGVEATVSGSDIILAELRSDATKEISSTQETDSIQQEASTTIIEKPDKSLLRISCFEGQGSSIEVLRESPIFENSNCRSRKKHGTTPGSRTSTPLSTTSNINDRRDTGLGILTPRNRAASPNCDMSPLRVLSNDNCTTAMSEPNENIPTSSSKNIEVSMEQAKLFSKAPAWLFGLKKNQQAKMPESCRNYGESQKILSPKAGGPKTLSFDRLERLTDSTTRVSKLNSISPRRMSVLKALKHVSPKKKDKGKQKKKTHGSPRTTYSVSIVETNEFEKVVDEVSNENIQPKTKADGLGLFSPVPKYSQRSTQQDEIDDSKTAIDIPSKAKTSPNLTIVTDMEKLLKRRMSPKKLFLRKKYLRTDEVKTAAQENANYKGSNSLLKEDDSKTVERTTGSALDTSSHDDSRRSASSKKRPQSVRSESPLDPSAGVSYPSRFSISPRQANRNIWNSSSIHDKTDEKVVPENGNSVDVTNVAVKTSSELVTLEVEAKDSPRPQGNSPVPVKPLSSRSSLQIMGDGLAVVRNTTRRSRLKPPVLKAVGAKESLDKDGPPEDDAKILKKLSVTSIDTEKSVGKVSPLMESSSENNSEHSSRTNLKELIVQQGSSSQATPVESPTRRSRSLRSPTKSPLRRAMNRLSSRSSKSTEKKSLSSGQDTTTPTTQSKTSAMQEKRAKSPIKRVLHRVSTRRSKISRAAVSLANPTRNLELSAGKSTSAKSSPHLKEEKHRVTGDYDSKISATKETREKSPIKRVLSHFSSVSSKKPWSRGISASSLRIESTKSGSATSHMDSVPSYASNAKSTMKRSQSRSFIANRKSISKEQIDEKNLSRIGGRRARRADRKSNSKEIIDEKNPIVLNSLDSSESSKMGGRRTRLHKIGRAAVSESSLSVTSNSKGSQGDTMSRRANNFDATKATTTKSSKVEVVFNRRRSAPHKSGAESTTNIPKGSEAGAQSAISLRASAPIATSSTVKAIKSMEMLNEIRKRKRLDAARRRAVLGNLAPIVEDKPSVQKLTELALEMKQTKKLILERSRSAPLFKDDGNETDEEHSKISAMQLEEIRKEFQQGKNFAQQEQEVDCNGTVFSNASGLSVISSASGLTTAEEKVARRLTNDLKMLSEIEKRRRKLGGTSTGTRRSRSSAAELHKSLSRLKSKMKEPPQLGT